MSRLTDHLKDIGEGIPADPLPDDIKQGDSSETEVWDDNDTPPGVDPRTGKKVEDGN